MLRPVSIIEFQKRIDAFADKYAKVESMPPTRHIWGSSGEWSEGPYDLSLDVSYSELWPILSLNQARIYDLDNAHNAFHRLIKRLGWWYGMKDQHHIVFFKLKETRKNPHDTASMNMGEVHPNLFVGSAPVYCLPVNFDVIVFMAEEFQPEFADPPEQLLIYAPIRDADPTAAERTRAMNVACAIVKHLKEGKQVLVTCISGWNRSAFAAGLAMRMMGVPTRKIVTKMRSARGEDALGNPHFLAILEAV